MYPCTCPSNTYTAKAPLRGKEVDLINLGFPIDPIDPVASDRFLKRDFW
jgi:hypothetical protein